MTGEHDKERARAIEEAAAHGWVEVGVNPKTGYTKMQCSCAGKHTMWLPKTPSNPNTYRRKVGHMQLKCEQWRAEHPQDQDQDQLPGIGEGTK